MRVLFFTLILAAHSVAFSAPSQGLLEDLRVLKNRESKRFFYIRKQLAKAGPENIELLREQFKEHKNRTDLLDRLIFYTDSHLKPTDNEKKFLQQACLKLAVREVQNTDKANNGQWRFFKNFSSVLYDNKESDLSATVLLESYMSYASVTNPKPAKGFMSPRDYTNGSQYETAKTVSRELVGDIVQLEEKQELKEQTQSLSQPQLKPVFITETEKSQEKN